MIWFDLDNSPHVPLFRPIFAELSRRRQAHFITARDFAQTKDLLALWNIPHTMLGRHGGKSKIGKLVNLLQRGRELARLVRGQAVTLAVSHGSRTQLVAAASLGIPAVLMLDYEYTETRIFNTLATYLLMPAAIPDQRLAQAGFKLSKVIRYAGFKEEVYLRDFTPDPAFRPALGLAPQEILVTLRPPSIVGNYHNDKSEALFRACLEFFSAQQNVQCVIVNRTAAERRLLPAAIRRRSNLRVLERAVDGLQLLWASDVVVSGGGTMNREAALLGVPTYSIFTGRRPYLDEYLQEAGRMTFIEQARQIDSIPLQPRDRTAAFTPGNPNLPAEITEVILNLRRRGVA